MAGKSSAAGIFYDLLYRIKIRLSNKTLSIHNAAAISEHIAAAHFLQMKRHHLLSRRIRIYRDKHFEYNISIKKAPIGAVKRMETTATVRMISPDDKPIERGMAPIAACTVAFGV